MKKFTPKCCIWIFGCGFIVIASLILVFLWFEANLKSDFYDKLPKTAKNIQEANIDLFPDYTYYLKAELPVEDLDNYIQKLGLEYTLAGYLLTKGHYDFMKPDWWDVPEIVEKQFYYEEFDKNGKPSYREDIYYKNGIVYVVAYTF